MTQKPGFHRSVMEERQRLCSGNVGRRPRFPDLGTFPIEFCYRKYSRRRLQQSCGNSQHSAWNLNSFSRTIKHHKQCILSHSLQESKEFGLGLSFSGRLLQGAIKVAMSMTCGTGGSSISRGLTFNYVIPSCTGPFALLKFDFWKMPTADICLSIEMQKKRYCAFIKMVRHHQQMSMMIAIQ